MKVEDATPTARTITNDVTNYSFTTPRGTQDITGVDKSAHEILLLLADYSVTLNGVFNTASDMSHEVFSTISSTSATRAVEIDPIGTASGDPVLIDQLRADRLPDHPRGHRGADVAGARSAL